MKTLFIVLIIILFSCKDNIVSSETQPDVASKIAVVEAALDAIENEEHGLETVDETNPENGTINSSYIRSTLYHGTLNDNVKIKMYLKESKNPCGGDLTFFTGMYKYENQDQWILLEISTDRQKKNYCMVEDGFSGVLFLEETENSLSGKWVSPDTKKQFKVELNGQLLDTKFAKDDTIVEELDNILFDVLIYEKNDC